MSVIEKHIDDVKKLCEYHHVEELHVFGSVVSTKFNKESDIDFLVEFGEIEVMKYLDNFLDFKKSLEHLFNRKIDLVEKQTINNPIFKRSIDRDKKRIYARKDSKISL